MKMVRAPTDSIPRGAGLSGRSRTWKCLAALTQPLPSVARTSDMRTGKKPATPFLGGNTTFLSSQIRLPSIHSPHLREEDLSRTISNPLAALGQASWSHGKGEKFHTFQAPLCVTASLSGLHLDNLESCEMSVSFIFHFPRTKTSTQLSLVSDSISINLLVSLFVWPHCAFIFFSLPVGLPQSPCSFSLSHGFFPLLSLLSSL